MFITIIINSKITQAIHNSDGWWYSLEDILQNPPLHIQVDKNPQLIC